MLRVITVTSAGFLAAAAEPGARAASAIAPTMIFRTLMQVLWDGCDASLRPSLGARDAYRLRRCPPLHFTKESRPQWSDFPDPGLLAPLIDICPLSELPPGTTRVVEVED